MQYVAKTLTEVAKNNFLPKPLKVFCFIVGDDNPFLVTISQDDYCHDLKSKIRDSQGFTFAAQNLELYLAVKDGNWLKYKDDDMRGLSHSIQPNAVSSSYTHAARKLHPTEAVSHYFSKEAQPAFDNDHSIHVVVVLPKFMEKKRKYCHSQLSGTKGEAYIKDVGIVITYREHISVEHPTARGYNWETLKDSKGEDITIYEIQQKNRYRDFLEENIRSVLNELQLCVLNVEGHKKLLSAEIPGLNIELAGGTDLLILGADSKRSPRNLSRHLDGVKLLIEVKRTPNVERCVNQTISELIALDLRVQGHVMALLTDFNSYWDFYWIAGVEGSKNVIHGVTFDDVGAAFEAIRSLISQPHHEPTLKFPFIEQSLERCKFKPILHGF